MAETETQVEGGHGGHEVTPADRERAHPGVGEYVRVAVVLAVVTLIEIALFYMDFVPDGVLVFSLLVLSTIKFGLVALWFMHLRFDSPLFARLFVTGIVLALTVFIIVLLTFGVFLG
ncbi:MAG: cytochrome C oxidase subunit IV family protein [Actinomycetota bacterium]